MDSGGGLEEAAVGVDAAAGREGEVAAEIREGRRRRVRVKMRMVDCG